MPQSDRDSSQRTRRLSLALAGLGALALLTACMQQNDSLPTQGKNMTQSQKDVASFDVVLFSYLDRPIFDVYLNGTDIGVAGPFGGGGGLMTGVAVPLGRQMVSWRLDGVDEKGKPYRDNGETTKATNQPTLLAPDPKKTYLGVYIYPDDTVEIAPSQYWPETTARGSKLYQEWKKNHGE